MAAAAAVAGDGGGDGADDGVRDLFGSGNEVYMRTQPLSPWPLPGGSLSYPSSAAAATLPPPRAPSAAEGRRLEAAVQLAQQLAAQTQADDDGAEHVDNMPSGSGRTYKQPSARFARPTPSPNAARPEQHQQLLPPPPTMYPTVTPGTVCVAAFNMGPVGHLNTALQRKTDFQQPKQIACFSRSADGSVTYDDRQLRLFHPPKLGADLSEGIGSYIAKSRGKGVGDAAPLGDVLDSLLAHNASLQDVHFVSYRNNLNKILGTAYNRVDPWEMGVERHGGTIFLDVHQMDESHRESDWQRRCMYWGYSFERFCTAPEESKEPVNANEEFCSILRTKLGLHRLVLAAEVDCYRVDSKQRRQFMELKTHGDLTTPKKAAAFEDRKLRQFWIQSFLAGIGRIVVGFRDDKGRLLKLEDLDTFSIPRRAKGKWEAAVCLAFADDVLTWLQHSVLENCQYVLKFDPNSNLLELCQVHAGIPALQDTQRLQALQAAAPS